MLFRSVIQQKHNEDSPHLNKDDWYLIQLTDGTQKHVFFRNIFPRSPVCDWRSRKEPMDVWREIGLYDKANVRHRKGHHLGLVSTRFILSKVEEELDELSRQPDDIEEMADVMATLIHYCVRMGWTKEQLDETILNKLYLRLGDRAYEKEQFPKRG